MQPKVARTRLTPAQQEAILLRAKLKENYAKIAADYQGLNANDISIVCRAMGYQQRHYTRKPKPVAPVKPVPQIPMSLRIQNAQDNLRICLAGVDKWGAELESLRSDLNKSMDLLSR